VTDGEAMLSDVFPPHGLAFRAPSHYVGADGNLDVAGLHRLASFTWYACERIAEAGAQVRRKKSWVQRAWVDPAFDYIEEHPGCGVPDVAEYVGVDVSTVYKHKRVVRAVNFAATKLRPGTRIEGKTDGVVNDDE
jgi:hypothetical protein